MPRSSQSSREVWEALIVVATMGAERNALRKAADELFGEMCLWLKPGANVRSWGMERSVRTGANKMWTILLKAALS